jgi:predicted glycogen debranching enzyme
MLDFGRNICCDEQQTTRHEWLVTNGIGGYASGTIGNLLTRRYHGLLVAALKPPLGRTLLLAKLDETASYDGHTWPLFANRWSEELIDPFGFYHLERFGLEGTTPVWTFTLADALLEKRVWMAQGENTTYIHYHLKRGSGPLSLSIKALVNYRDYHENTNGGDWQMQVVPVKRGVRVDPFFSATSFYLLSSQGEFTPEHTWYHNFWLAMEQYRGELPHDDHLCIGTLHATIEPGETLTIVASTRAISDLDGPEVYAQHQHDEQQVIARCSYPYAPAWVHQLMLAARQFIVHRPSISSSDEAGGKTIIAGYHWFGDWGRDTMISLPGLTLASGTPDVAANILRTFARYISQGMLPNRFPDDGEEPEYNTVDAALWYIEAIRAYYDETGDTELLAELFSGLQDIIAWHRHGTRYGIRVDPEDGLLYAGDADVQLTWMDAKVGDWVVTPRTGKPVEINALWYNMLCTMADFAQVLSKSARPYEQAAEQVRASFARFWNEQAGYCYDVLDGPEGRDDALRPNQLFAVSLHHSPLDPQQQRLVVDTCARHLLTSYGLRSLAPDNPAYVGTYGGDQHQRDSSYHQGTVWGWLIGSFVAAHLRVYNDPVQAQSFLQPFAQHLAEQGIGSISEIFDGDAPFTPRGCIAQAWSVAEVLRVWRMTTRSKSAS